MKLLALALIMFLSGCAHQHGVYRDTTAEDFPPSDEVLAVLRQIPDVKNATHFTHAGRTPLDRALGINKGSIEEFAIRGETIGFNMQFTTRGGQKYISMQMFTHESRPASFRVEEVRNLMRTVYAELRAKFPGLPPENNFHEITEGMELETN